MADDWAKRVEDAKRYLATGGLGETMVGIDVYRIAGLDKVSIDADHAYALCLLAAEAIDARKTKAVH